MLISLFNIFFMTFVVFPGAIFDETIGFESGIDENVRISWEIQTFIFIFNVCDTCGRYLAGRIHLNEKVIAIGSFGRVIFIVFSIFIVYHDDLTDILKMANLVLFAFTNGYISTQCCIKAPSGVALELKEQVGTLVSISIPLGILTGSIIAIPITSSLLSVV